MMPFKLVITGPESSGKTTLAVDLAGVLGAALVPEFARVYLQWLGRPYVKTDLGPIHRGQHFWERWHEQQTPGPWLVCDTDWTVLRIWENYLFDETVVTAKDLPATRTFYFLCSPDIPWQPDPLREHPHERHLLYKRYHDLLTELQAPFLVLEGSRKERLAKALEQIQKIS